MSTPRGYTQEACHACGKAGLRPKNRVCNECKRVFDRFTKLDAERMAQNEAGGDSPLPHLFRERAYALPYVGHCDRDSLQGAFFALGQEVSAPTIGAVETSPPDRDHSHPWVDTSKWDVWPRHANDRGDWMIVRDAPRRVALALRAAYAATMAAIDQAYATGHEEGRDLLAQLASGGITVDEFNEAALRREKRKM